MELTDDVGPRAGGNERNLHRVIEIICANSPQAKGRVERMNQTLQDRLVKELRLRGICNMEDGNGFLPEYMGDYNQRFQRVARNPHDAHRPLQDGEDLAQIFSWQEERTLSRSLTVHFNRVTYLVEPGPKTLPLGGKRVRVHEWDDGRVEIRSGGIPLPYSIFDQNPHVTQGAIVENKRLGAALSFIQGTQIERDRVRLASKKLTIRQKDRIRSKPGSAAAPAPVSSEGYNLGAVASFFKRFEQEQIDRRKAANLRAAQRRQERDRDVLNPTSLLCQEADISTQPRHGALETPIPPTVDTSTQDCDSGLERTGLPPPKWWPMADRGPPAAWRDLPGAMVWRPPTGPHHEMYGRLFSLSSSCRISELFELLLQTQT